MIKRSARLPEDPPGIIDTGPFTEAGQQLAGQTTTDRLERLDESLAGPAGLVDWQFDGHRTRLADGSRQQWLHLRARLAAGVLCARCDEVVAIEVEFDHRYLLVATERQAEQLDSDAQDFDVLVASRQFSLTDLLEDECLMALPAFATHDTCEPVVGDRAGESTSSAADSSSSLADGAGRGDDGSAQPPDAQARPNPFAVLAKLRRGSNS